MDALASPTPMSAATWAGLRDDDPNDRPASPILPATIPLARLQQPQPPSSTASRASSPHRATPLPLSPAASPARDADDDDAVLVDAHGAGEDDEDGETPLRTTMRAPRPTVRSSVIASNTPLPMSTVSNSSRPSSVTSASAAAASSDSDAEPHGIPIPPPPPAKSSFLGVPGFATAAPASPTPTHAATSPQPTPASPAPSSYSSFFKSSLEKLRWGATAATTTAKRAVSPNPATSDPHLARAASGESVQSEDDDVDWEFWGKVIQDYDTIARRHPKQLLKQVQMGIPAKVRGTVWLLMSGAKSAELEREFQRLLPLPSPFEKLIQRDLPRTFPGHPFFATPGGPGQEALFHVVKAYSIFDPEVGYCQGLSFVAGPLLLNMPDEEAFCVLVKLLKTYGLRGHYTPHMDGLQLRMFQFDQLLVEQMPDVHEHLTREGVRSTMYASQWFMTLFAYRFPLDLVLRVFDLIFAEGVEVLLKFALALLKKHETHLLTLEFESLLEFLKTGLFEYYATHGNEFVEDAIKIKVTKRRLDQLAAQYDQDVKLADAHLVLMETLKAENRRLEDRIKTLERNLTLVNQEHVDLANELIQTKLDYTSLREANEALAKQVHDLRAMILEEREHAEQRRREQDGREDADKRALQERNNMLGLQLQEMQDELVVTKLKFAESEADRDQIAKKLAQLKRALDL
ncbi:GTPase-activating protein [Allomyces arbusculus]|nr:GTPase-activating protein [Allomyces arbusculus]